jgi:hypothetical protein
MNQSLSFLQVQAMLYNQRNRSVKEKDGLKDSF